MSEERDQPMGNTLKLPSEIEVASPSKVWKVKRYIPRVIYPKNTNDLIK